MTLNIMGLRGDREMSQRYKISEFEKWSRSADNDFPISVHNERKRGWKAALKWVLNEGIDDWTEDIIKEELNAKT